MCLQFKQSYRNKCLNLSFGKLCFLIHHDHASFSLRFYLSWWWPIITMMSSNMHKQESAGNWWLKAVNVPLCIDKSMQSMMQWHMDHEDFLSLSHSEPGQIWFMKCDLIVKDGFNHRAFWTNSDYSMWKSLDTCIRVFLSREFLFGGSWGAGLWRHSRHRHMQLGKQENQQQDEHRRVHLNFLGWQLSQGSKKSPKVSQVKNSFWGDFLVRWGFFFKGSTSGFEGGLKIQMQVARTSPKWLQIQG